jgi:serine O-acetyltransferase
MKTRLRVAWRYIKSDYHRYSGGGINSLLIDALTARNFCFAYSFWLRLCRVGGIIGFLAKVKRWRMARKYGLQIQPETQIGYGFYIGHGVGAVISPGTIIGNNCNISQYLSIGTNDRHYAVIGNNVYIGPHVCIVGGVRIGNNVTIGAGAVVVKDVPDNATVAGVPARVLNYNEPGKYIVNKFVET